MNSLARELADVRGRASDSASTGAGAATTNVEVDIAPARFYEFATVFADFHLYQMPAFATVMAALQGAKTSNIVVFRGDVPIGACVFRITTIPILGWRVAYALGGPLWRRPNAGVAELSSVLAAIRLEYVRRRNMSVWLRPRLWRESPHADLHRATFYTNDFHSRSTPTAGRTLLLDLRPPANTIRQRLHRSWRRYLLKAERSGLEIGTDRSDASFATLLPLYAELKKEKGFRGIDGELMRRVNATAPTALRMHTTLCHRAGRIIAGQIASHVGDEALGVIGAANPEGREFHAAYLVWWERLLRAKEDGCNWYDMGGFDDVANPSVAQAKLRMGGRVATFLGEFRCEPSYLRASLLRRLSGLRGRLRRRK